MSKVVVFMSVSLDGFLAGPHPAPTNPLGDNGLLLHDWFFKDQKAQDEVDTRYGAAIIGRVMYDESQPYWDGKGPLGDKPCIVLTEKGTEPEKAGSMFTFTDDIEEALALAKKAAGDKDICIGGGANVIQQYVKAGLADELDLHIVPILLGGGTSLFGSLGKLIELEQLRAESGDQVAHVLYRPKKRHS